MITRYALFEGKVKDGETEAFRDAFSTKAVPLLRLMPHVQMVKVSFSEYQDDAAIELPIILAITYPDLQKMTVALESPERQKAKQISEAILAEYFVGHTHHHVVKSFEF
jgi:hypothetical protein